LVTLLFRQRNGGSCSRGGPGGGAPVSLKRAVPSESFSGAVQLGQFLIEAGDGWSAAGCGCLGQQPGLFGSGGLPA
jgi:hypothetical protein